MALTTDGWYNYRVSAAGFVSVFNRVRPQANTYRWTDPDRNNDYTPGEVNLTVGGPDYITTSGGNTNRKNLDLKQPHTHEITTSFEKEVAAETSLRLLYVFRQTKDDWEIVNPLRDISVYNTPITRRDPGPDGRLETADDAGRVTFYDFNPLLRTAVASQFRTRSNTDHFNTGEVSFTKRRSDRWSIVSSFQLTKNHRYVERTTAVANTPNDQFFPIDNTL